MIALALRGVLVGVMLGNGVLAAALWGVRTLQLGMGPNAAAEPRSAAGNLLLLGSLGGVAVSVAATWVMLAGIGSTYRRGAFALVAAFATIMFSLVSIPVDAALGRAGLLLLAGVWLLGALWFGRRRA